MPRYILSIDTSTKFQSLALVDDAIPLARRLHRIKLDHSDTLLHNVSDLLEQQRVAVADLSLVAVGLGPGSFTGLRVGLANAKALARAAGADIVGVSSLAAVARPSCYMHEGPVVVAIDARRSEVYTATYRGRGSDFEALDTARTARPDDLRAHILELAAGADVLVVGDGVRRYSEQLGAFDHPRIRVLDGPWDPPSSVSIAFLGRSIVDTEGPHDLNTLEPDYIRPSDAKAPRPAPFGPETAS
jgi:tRNA threonylcarbamoyladenosine biosynthesis protein TsaB